MTLPIPPRSGGLPLHRLHGAHNIDYHADAVAGGQEPLGEVARRFLMAAVSLQLARAALVDWLTAALAVLALVALARFRVNSAWLVIAGGVVGLATRMALD
jgi:hypothetical protein